MEIDWKDLENKNGIFIILVLILLMQDKQRKLKRKCSEARNESDSEGEEDVHNIVGGDHREEIISGGPSGKPA